MSGSVDWGAIAKLAQSAQNLGKVQPGYVAPKAPQPASFNVPSTSKSPGGWSSFPYHNNTGLVNGTAPGTVGYQNGVGLAGPLNLPASISPSKTFTWSIDDSPNTRTRTLTQMTLAGSLSWLRDLAVHNKQMYNEVVLGLVQAGYLTAAEARYNSYTSKVASKFLQSAIDVEQINNDNGVNAQNGGGAVTTWWNHIQDLAQGRIDSGQLDANGMPTSGGGGGGGGTPTPTRTDVFTNPEDVKASINDAAKSVLGRHLTDAEVAQFASAFHGTEQSYNNQAWAQQQASAQNAATAPSAVRAPSVSAAAQNYVDDSPALGADRTNSLLGSYIGVLRNMTGLGSGGVSSAVG